jgi:tetratricopeptide (TPR) repeat protein
MIIRVFAVLLCFLSAVDPASGQDVLLRRRVQEGQNSIYRLDYASAERIFNSMKTEKPDSPVGYAMLAFTAWHQLLFASRNLALHEYGIPMPFGGEPVDPAVAIREHARFEEANDVLQKVCQRQLDKNPRDTLALYFMGYAKENLATEAFALDKASGRARSYGNQAKNIHEKVLSLDPSFVDANTSIAIYEYVVATLPGIYKWLAWMIGIRGSKEVALQRLRDVAARGTFRATDSLVVTALLEAWKGDPRLAVSIYKDLHERFPESFLLDISLAVAYEQANDRKSALQVYQDLLQNLPRKAAGVQPGEIHLRIGRIYVNLRESTLALQAFERALQAPQGDRETRPLAYYQMALIHEQRSESAQAKECYRHVLEYSGNALKDEISQARRNSR